MIWNAILEIHQIVPSPSVMLQSGVVMAIVSYLTYCDTVSGGGQRQQLAAYGGSTSYADDDESESEDEAPRRSRHGQGKKRRKETDGGESGEQRWDVGTSPWEIASGEADDANF